MEDLKSMKNLLSRIKLGSLEQVTTLIGLIGQLATYIQVFKIFYLKSAYAVSFIAALISLISMVFWLLYGVQKRVKPLIICNIFGIIGVALVLLGIMLYGNSIL